MRSLALLLVAVLALLSGCASSPPSKAIDCGPPTGLVPHPATPELTGVPLGPLLIRGAFPVGATKAKVLGFEHGRPTKMLVVVGHDMDNDITLTGVRCSDSLPLRFWLNKGGGGIWTFGPTSSPVPDDVMATTGDLRAVLPKLSALPGGSQGYGGYLLFPTADTYRIEAFVDSRKIGDGVLLVSSEPFPAGRPSPSPESEPVDVAARTACATRVLQSLVTAINAGDGATPERLIGAGPTATQAFQWVALTTRGPANVTDYAPDVARRALLARAASGERWTLTSVLASPGPSWHGGVDAEVHLERTLADHSVVRTSGKTALSCIGSAVYVLSLGDD